MRSAPLPCGRSCAANAARFHLGAVQRKPVQGSQDACLHFDGRDAGRACNAQAARKGELLPHGAPWHFEWRSFKKGTQSSGRKRAILGGAFCAEQTASIWPSRKLPRTGLAAVHRVTLLRTSSYYTEPTSLVRPRLYTFYFGVRSLHRPQSVARVCVSLNAASMARVAKNGPGTLGLGGQGTGGDRGGPGGTEGDRGGSRGPG